MTSTQVDREGHVGETLVRTTLEVELISLDVGGDDLPLAVSFVCVQVDLRTEGQEHISEVSLVVYNN